MTLHGRIVDEWVGKTPDTKIPARVRLRVFRRYDGRDYITGRKIMAGDAWDLDHIIALINGGEHRESNLAPALRDKSHKAKTAEDVAAKAHGDRAAMRHAGIKRSSRPFQSRGFTRSNPQHSASRPIVRKSEQETR